MPRDPDAIKAELADLHRLDNDTREQITETRRVIGGLNARCTAWHAAIEARRRQADRLLDELLEHAE